MKNLFYIKRVFNKRQFEPNTKIIFAILLLLRLFLELIF